MGKNEKKRPEFSLEGFFVDSQFIEVRHVAANYFNLAHNNFYKTLIFILTRSGMDRKFLNSINFQEEKIGEALQLFFDATFGKEDRKQVIYDQYFDRHKRILEKEGKENNQKSSSDKITEVARERAEKDFSQLVLTKDLQARIQKKLFHYIPAFGPIMADVASYEAYKNRQKSENLKDKNEEKIMLGITFQHCLETLILVAHALIYYRNYYTHEVPYNAPEAEVSQAEREVRLVKLMNNVFKASQRLDKKRELVSTEAMTFLTGHGVNERMLEIPNGEETYFDKKTHQKKSRKLYRYVESPLFYFKIAGKTYMTQSGREANYLSDFGKLFFCCLFLKKQQGVRFAEESQLFHFSPFMLKGFELKNIQEKENQRVDKENDERKRKGVKRMAKAKVFTKMDSPQHEIILDMLGVYHIRRPIEKRIDTKSTPGTLTMDMLNELRRCPSELFHTFSAEDKEIFEREVSDPKDGSPRSVKAEEKVKLIRSTDRFPHLALRYIDEVGLLGDIRFQIRLGNYRFHFYDKVCVDGTPKVRSWQKEINGFGKWQEIEEKRRAKWVNDFQKREYVNTQQEYGEMELEQPVKDTAATMPYITDWTATYNIHKNRIGLQWGLVEGIYLPDLKYILEPADEEKEQKKQRHRALVDMKQPLCSLSVYDLPALLFYQDLWNHYHGAKYELPKAEQIIKNAYEGLNAFISAVKSGQKGEELEQILTQYKLRMSYIPKRLRQCIVGQEKLKKFNNANYLKLVESVYGRYDHMREEYVPGKLGEKLEEIEYRIKAFDDKKKKIDSGDNKYAKRGYADIRHGVLARYLSDSFVKWQPTKAKGQDKITGLDYSMMTAFLSAYGSQNTLEELKNMLIKAGLIGGNNPHPFLDGVVDSCPQNIEELYIEYLEKEKEEVIRLNKHECKLKSFKGNNQDKIDYINRNRADIDDVLSQIPFAHPGREKWRIAESVDTYFKEYAGRYNTLMLPDGLFTSYIASLLRQCLPEDKILNERLDRCSTDNRQSLGASWFIEYYFEHYMKDEHQSFYNPFVFKRAYKPFTTMNNRFVPNGRGGFTSELVPYYNNGNEIQEKLAYTEKNIKDFVYNKWRGREKKEKIESLKSQIKDVKETEKQIRRYKTQDVILFLAAKDLLIKQLSDDKELSSETKQTREKIKAKASQMKLKDFDFDEGFAFLSEGENSGAGVEFDYQYKAKNGQVVTISQKGVSLKNYGNIYRILGDDRFQSLMEGLAKIGVKSVAFSDLTTEFANYDDKRSEIFKIVHAIEGKAFIEHSDELKNPNNPVFHIDNNPEKAPRRNSFKNMLELLEVYGAKDRDVMIAIRNAVGHDYYMDITLLDCTNSKSIRVPNIALLMQHTMNKRKDNPNKKE